jgi:hypothetical protein
MNKKREEKRNLGRLPGGHAGIREGRERKRL